MSIFKKCHYYYFRGSSKHYYYYGGWPSRVFRIKKAQNLKHTSTVIFFEKRIKHFRIWVSLKRVVVKCFTEPTYLSRNKRWIQLNCTIQKMPLACCTESMFPTFNLLLQLIQAWFLKNCKMIKRRKWNINLTLSRGCGSIDRAIASNIKRPGFESSHRSLFQIFICC